MEIRKRIVALLVFVVLFIPGNVYAQKSDPNIELSLIRNFGYGGLGEIQGNFTLKIRDALADLDTVDFYLDDDLIAEIGQEPYEYKFHTSHFPEGEHVFSAVGTLSNGTEVQSNQISKIILSSDQAWSQTQRLIVPILVFTAGATALGLGASVLASRKKEFVIGKYGPAGGAVCPRCELPFGRSIFSPNLAIGKLVRCPHCGKITIRARASQPQLEQAEKKYINADTRRVVTPLNDQEYHKLLDESKYED
jgi:hypothetical protein